MVNLNVSGATNPTECNGVYKVYSIEGGKENYKHISKGYYIFWNPTASQWLISNRAGKGQGETNYFFRTNIEITGIYGEDEGTGNVIVTFSNAGTIGTAILRTDYIDKAYMGSNNEAVEVS
jgi:hypothetical protein